MEGINDIGMARSNPTPSAADLIAGHKQLIERAHARGLEDLRRARSRRSRARPTSRPKGEAKRQALNEWIRTSQRLRRRHRLRQGRRAIPAAPTKFAAGVRFGRPPAPGRRRLQGDGRRGRPGALRERLMLASRQRRVRMQTSRSGRAAARRRAVARAAAALVMAATLAARPRAQAFANLKSALVELLRTSNLEPRKALRARSGSSSRRRSRRSRRAPSPRTAPAPAHCRVSGMLSPEIAFEVNLPAKWNGRFYMIGNGGLAGESARRRRPRVHSAAPALANWLRHGADEHRARRAQGAVAASSC